MPIKLSEFPLRGTLEQELDKLRHTLKDDEGMTVQELAEKLNRSDCNINQTLRRKKWSIRICLGRNGVMQHVLVNPKVLKRHQQKPT